MALFGYPLFEFHWPWFGLLLPLPLILPLLWRERHGTRNDEPLEGLRVTLMHPHLKQLRAAYQAQGPRRQLAGWLYRLLLMVLWAGLIVALMRPQGLVPHTEVSSPGYDLMLAVDASMSMKALDFTSQGQQVSRMGVVKGVMGRFVEARTGDRIGLVVFGTEAYVLSPLTIDRNAVQQLLADVEPAIAGKSTALGDAIALGVKKLRQRPKGSRVMILVADGDNTAGGFQPLEAADLARLWGVRVYVIGVGSKKERIPIDENNDGILEYRDDLTMNEDTLQSIAEITGGAYFRATDTRALEEISRRINELEKTETETRTAYLPEPLYRWPLGAALLALLGLGLFPEGRRRFARGAANV